MSTNTSVVTFLPVNDAMRQHPPTQLCNHVFIYGCMRVGVLDTEHTHSCAHCISQVCAHARVLFLAHGASARMRLGVCVWYIDVWFRARICKYNHPSAPKCKYTRALAHALNYSPTWLPARRRTLTDASGQIRATLECIMRYEWVGSVANTPTRMQLS
jgi:hypothetical protein